MRPSKVYPKTISHPIVLLQETKNKTKSDLIIIDDNDYYDDGDGENQYLNCLNLRNACNALNEDVLFFSEEFDTKGEFFPLFLPFTIANFY